MASSHQRKRRKRNKAQIYTLDDISAHEDILTISNSLTARVTRTVVAAVPLTHGKATVDPSHTGNSMPSIPQPIDDSPSSVRSDLGYLEVKTKAKRYQNSVSSYITYIIQAYFWPGFSSDYLEGTSPGISRCLPRIGWSGSILS